MGKGRRDKPRRPKAPTQGPSGPDVQNSAREEYKILLAELGIAVDAPSAASIGFVGPSRIEEVGGIYITRSGPDTKEIRIFLNSLRTTPNEQRQRLLEHILPHCDIEKLVAFALLSVHPDTGKAFVSGRDNRGEKIKAALKKRVRKNESHLRAARIIDPFAHRERQLERDKQILANVERTKPRPGPFDTRRMGLTQDWPSLLVISKYLEFKSGLTLRPRDMGAILQAAYAASGKPRKVDSDLLTRGLRRYAKRHPDFLVSGPSSARIIERTPHTSQ